MMKLNVCMLLCLCWIGVDIVVGWGPVSHYYFARQAFPSSPVDSSLKQSCDVPDGVYFSSWSENTVCDLPVGDFHNGITAGYFVKYASTSDGQRFKSNTFDPMTFSLGYGSHMIADKVGFYTQGKGGYLGPTVQSYVTFFPFMTNIDALVTTRDSFPPNTNWTSNEAIEYLSAATQYYHTVSNGQFGFYNVTAVANCLNPWAITAEDLHQMAQLQVSTGYYKTALQVYDRYQASTFEEAERNFESALECVVVSIRHWAALASVGDTTPEDAYTQTLAFIKSLFDAGKCIPQ